MSRPVPEDFVAQLRATFGAGHDVRWNEAVSRWEIISPSADGKPCSQFWGWFYDPVTRQRLEPDPVTGLLPFRDLDATAQGEILRNMEASFIGHPEEGGSWHQRYRTRTRFNQALHRAKVRQRAVNFADMIHEVNLARPWVKHHSGPARARRVAYRGT